MSEKIVLEKLSEPDLINIIHHVEGELHSLRLAVAQFFNEFEIDLTNSKGFEQLALSAGITYDNGTWILKEGE